MPRPKRGFWRALVAVALVAAACEPAGVGLAPDTVIDGYTIGAVWPECGVPNAECSTILDLARAGTLSSAEGKAAVARCSLSAQECRVLAGEPERGGVRKAPGLAEIVGVAEDQLVAENPAWAPASIVRFRAYGESLKPYTGPNGEILARRSGLFVIVVFEMGDGSRRAAGVACGVDGSCHASR